MCDVPGIGQIQDTFVAYDEAGKTFTYEATGLPFFVKQAHNSWVIRAITDVTFQGNMMLLPVIASLMAIPMKMQLTRLLDNATEELNYYVETGEIHPRKQALVAKSARPARVY